MPKKNAKRVMPYFELLCFAVAWFVGLSVAWSASHQPRHSDATARIASSQPLDIGVPSAQ